MTTFGNPLHEDSNSFKTSSSYGNVGDGSNDWFLKTRQADGADITQGAIADAAVTNPASSASTIALLKGLLTMLGVGASTLLKAEDAAAVSGDAGVQALTVRRDAPTSSAGTDGDYSPLSVDSLGRLRIAGTHAEDAAHASGDLGVMNLGVQNEAKSALSGTAGDYTPLGVDRDGCLFVHLVPPEHIAYRLLTAVTTALATSLVVKAAAGGLHKLRVVNTGGAQYLQIHDASSLPADASVPVILYHLPAGASVELDFTAYGRYFSTGIVVCNSSTAATKTIGAADLWIDALYI